MDGGSTSCEDECSKDGEREGSTCVKARQENGYRWLVVIFRKPRVDSREEGRRRADVRREVDKRTRSCCGCEFDSRRDLLLECACRLMLIHVEPEDVEVMRRRCERAGEVALEQQVGRTVRSKTEEYRRQP